MLPSIKTLVTRLALTRDQAKQLREAMASNRGLKVYNGMSGGFGIEVIYLPEGCENRCETPDHVIRYVNHGDTYSTTLLKVDGRYRVGDWGYYVEKWS